MENPNGYPTKNVFADHRATSVGDIVTIIISENTTTTASRNNSNEKSGSVNMAPVSVSLISLKRLGKWFG